MKWEWLDRYSTFAIVLIVCLVSVIAFGSYLLRLKGTPLTAKDVPFLILFCIGAFVFWSIGWLYADVEDSWLPENMEKEG